MYCLWPPNQRVSRKISVLHLPDVLPGWFRASQGRAQGFVPSEINNPYPCGYNMHLSLHLPQFVWFWSSWVSEISDFPGVAVLPVFSTQILHHLEVLCVTPQEKKHGKVRLIVDWFITNTGNKIRKSLKIPLEIRNPNWQLLCCFLSGSLERAGMWAQKKLHHLWRFISDFINKKFLSFTVMRLLTKQIP